MPDRDDISPRDDLRDRPGDARELAPEVRHVRTFAGFATARAVRRMVDDIAALDGALAAIRIERDAARSELNNMHIALDALREELAFWRERQGALDDMAARVDERAAAALIAAHDAASAIERQARDDATAERQRGRDEGDALIAHARGRARRIVEAAQEDVEALQRRVQRLAGVQLEIESAFRGAVERVDGAFASLSDSPLSMSQQAKASLMPSASAPMTEPAPPSDAAEASLATYAPTVASREGSAKSASAQSGARPLVERIDGDEDHGDVGASANATLFYDTVQLTIAPLPTYADVSRIEAEIAGLEVVADVFVSAHESGVAELSVTLRRPCALAHQFATWSLRDLGVEVSGPDAIQLVVRDADDATIPRAA